MKKSLLAGIFLFATLSVSAQNLLQDGGFENTKTYNYASDKSTSELPRISSLSRLGSNTETGNPVMTAETVVQGAWYRKSANSGYNHGKIVNNDYSEGQKSLNLSLSSGNSTTTNLDTWYGNTAIQYVTIDRTKQYVLKFKAKTLVGNYPVFAGISVGGGYEVSGSNWSTLSSNWEEYTLTIDPTQHKSTDTHYSDADFQKSGVVFGNKTDFESNKTLESSILIDDVRLYVKGTEPGEEKPDEGDQKEFVVNGDFETGDSESSIVATTDPWGSNLVGKWALMIKGASTGSGTIIANDAHTGNQALKVDLTNISARYHFFVAQEIQNLAPAEYTFVMWMKASKADIPFRVDFIRDNNNTDILQSLQKTKTEWTKYEIKVNMSQISANDLSTLRISIRPNCKAEGSSSVQNEPVTYFIDDVSFKGIVPDVVLTKPEPYLQSKTTESILANWLSANGEEGTPTVEYGITDLSLSATGSTKSVGTLRWSGVRLSGLTPDTEYQYRCRIGDNVSETYKFRTLPDKNATRKIRFISIGDSHEPGSVIPIRESMLKYLKQNYGEDLQNHFDFITCTGDIIYNYGQYESEFATTLFAPNKELTHALPINIAAGNHDFEKNDSQHSYFYDFLDFTDLSDAQGDAKGKYYAQQVGNALYIYLNTNKQYLCAANNSNQTYLANTTAQLNWLKDKLTTAENDNTIDMVFILGHHGHRYEMWSAPDNSATRGEITERLFPEFENSTKIKMFMYGHTHSVERGILELKNGKSITLFLNGNGGSYPDYFGKYNGINMDYPEIHRNSEFIGFAITEVDPAAKSYQTTYYGVSQRRPVNGSESTSYIRKYETAEIIDQWSSKYNAEVPETPTVNKQEYNATSGTFSLEASSAADMISAQYQIINTATQAIAVDSIAHWENVFGVTGYFETTDGTIDLGKSYLPLDLNKDLDLSRFSVTLPAGNYKAKLRYRDQNLNWSEYSDLNTSVSKSEMSSDVVIAGGNGEVVIVSDGGTAEIYSPYGALLAKTNLSKGENRIGVTPDTQIIVRVIKDNHCTVKKLRIK